MRPFRCREVSLFTGKVPCCRGRRALYGCPDGAGLVLYMQVIPDAWIFGRDMENLEDFFAAGG